jgi:hypothetical protein
VWLAHLMGWALRARVFLAISENYGILSHGGCSPVASSGKLHVVPGPCARTAAQSYARAASSSEAKYPMCRLCLVCGSVSVTFHEELALY